MDKQLDARGARVGEYVPMVSLGDAEDLDNAHQQPVRAGSHVDGSDREPHRVDADHRSSSRIHAAHSDAALDGHVTTTLVGPR